MLPVGWLVVAVLAAILLTMWVTFTLTRLDRLHARVDAAQAALDAQLVRRAAALRHVAEAPDSGLGPADVVRYERLALEALAAVPSRRQDAENGVGRALVEISIGSVLVSPELAAELSEAANRVLIARRFYNDAVRDTRSLRRRRMPRLLRLAGRRVLPEFFDIDDTVPSFAAAAASGEARPAAARTSVPPVPRPKDVKDPV